MGSWILLAHCFADRITAKKHLENALVAAFDCL